MDVSRQMFPIAHQTTFRNSLPIRTNRYSGNKASGNVTAANSPGPGVQNNRHR